MPTPAWPITVTRCGRPSRTTRSNSDSEQRGLVLAADQRRRRRGRRESRCPRPSSRDGLPRRHRLGLALQRQRLELLVLDRAAGQPVGDLADGDAARPRRRLQARGDVHRVADHRVAVADLAGEHVARVDPHAQREADVGGGVDVLVDLLHRGLHREAGADGALGVVLVGDGRAEHRHHVVADVLVDRAAVAHDLLAEPPQRPVDERLHRLRIHAARRPPCSRRGRRTAPSPCGAPRGARRGERAPGRRGLGGDLAAEQPRAAGRAGCAGAWRRGRRGPAAVPPRRPRPRRRAVPHSMQNLAPGGLSAPQLGHLADSCGAAGHAEAGPLGVLGAAARAVSHSERQRIATNDTESCTSLSRLVDRDVLHPWAVSAPSRGAPGSCRSVRAW